MKHLTLTILFIISLLLPVWAWGADAYYYVRTTAAGSEDGSSFANAWAIADIDWSAINTKLATDDVYIYFKRGDTFGQMSILSWGTYIPSSTNRLYITVDPVDSGDKPHFSIASSGVWYYGIRWKNAGYITFDNLNIEDTGTATGSEGFHTGTGDAGSTANLNNKGYIHITDCDFSGWSHYAFVLMAAGDHCVITGNTFDDCGNAIYFGDEYSQGGSYHYIANNTATNIVGYAGTDGHLAGLQRINYSIIENNTGINVRGPIVLWVGSCSYTSEYNIIRNNTLETADYTGITIDGDNGDGCTSVNGNLVYKNVVSDTSNDVVRPAIRLNAVRGANGNRVFNNTIYNAQNWGLQNRRGTDYTYWKNNIVHISDRDGSYDKLFFSAPEGYTQGSNNEIDYNLYWTTPGDPSAYSDWINEDGNSYPWSTWKSTAGYDTNSQSPANPLMTDPANQDYTLTAASPAIDAGGYLTNVAEAAGNHTVITVSDIYWLHSDFGITDADGAAVDGMLISFYDTTNGLQNREITDIDYDTSEITVAATDIIYDAGDLTNPAATTQIALRFYSTRPDIGAEEFEEETTELKADWHFEDGALTTDSTETGTYTLTNVNTVVSSATHKEGSHSADFTAANSEYFTRTGTAGDFGWTSTNAFTICGWIQADTLPVALMDVFSKGTAAGNDYDFSVYVSSDGSPNVCIGYNVGASFECEEYVAANIVVDQWYYFCAAINDSGSAKEGLADQEMRIRIWDDTESEFLGTPGGDEETPSTANHWVPGEGGDLFIGSYGTAAYYWDGLIDGLVVYGKVLTSAEMDALRGGADTPTTIGTFSHCDTATGTADSGTTTTLVDDALTQADDYWNGSVIAITKASVVYYGVITDFVAGTDTLTFGALSVEVDNTCTYFMWGAEIAAETTYNAGDTCSLCLKTAAMDNLFTADGPSGNLQIGTDMSYPDKEEFEYARGIGTYTLLFSRLIQIGDRDLDLQAEGTAGGTGLIHGDTKLTGVGGTEIVYTLPQVDPAGGNIIIAAPYPSTAPHEFTDTADYVAWLLAGNYTVINDNFAWTEDADTEAFDASGEDGTSGNEITYDGQGFTITGSQTFGDYSIVKRFIHGSTVTLGLGDTHKYSLIPEGDILQVPEGATGCTVNDNTIRGTLDLDETVTIENTFVTTVDLSGIEDTGGVETATFNDCAFVQSEAAIDATLGANGVTSYDAGCQFEVTVANCFADYAGANFHLTSGSPLKDAGGDTGADTDLLGVATPKGTDHDIGPYEYFLLIPVIQNLRLRN